MICGLRNSSGIERICLICSTTGAISITGATIGFGAIGKGATTG
jgi:hypothetical protein